MKKLIAIIAGLLFVVVLAAAALILFDPFSGVKVKGEILEDEDIEDLVEDLEAFFEDSYSYEFKYTNSELERDQEERSEYKETSKGLVSVEYYDKEESSTVSYDVSAKVTNKTVVSSMNGKKVYKSIYDQDVVKLARDITREDSEDEYYVSSKETHKQNKSKSTSSYKTRKSYHQAYIPSLETLLMDYLKSPSASVYQNDDKYTIILSSSESFTEVKFTFDGRELTKFSSETKNADGKSKLTIKVVDFEEIEEPKNTGEYQSIPHEHSYDYETDKCSCGELNPSHVHNYWYNNGYCRCGDYDSSYAYE